MAFSRLAHDAQSLQPTTLELHLHTASVCGDFTTVTSLIERKACLHTHVNGITPLIAAAELNYCDVVRRIIAARADMDMCGEDGRTALSLADSPCATGAPPSLNAIGALITARADPPIQDANGQSPFDLAISGWSHAAIDALGRRNGTSTSSSTSRDDIEPPCAGRWRCNQGIMARGGIQQLLRHGTTNAGIRIRRDGFCSACAIAFRLNRPGRRMTTQNVVDACLREPDRFLCRDIVGLQHVRAIQRHTMPEVRLANANTQLKFLGDDTPVWGVHGT